MDLKSLPARVINKLDRKYDEFLLRKKISNTLSFDVDKNASVVVSILCGKSSFYEGIAALKSLFVFDNNLDLNWFSDGTLADYHIKELKAHFNGISVISKDEADQKTEAYLKSHKLNNALNYRREYVIGRRLFDFPLFADERRIFQLDSDILFLKKPGYLLNLFADNLKTNYYNQDIRTGYCYAKEQMNYFLGKEVLEAVNGGMVLRDGTTSIIHFVEEVFRQQMELIKQTQREQTLIALYFTKYGGNPLPPDYDVLNRYGRQSEVAQGDIVSQHYCDRLRPWFYKDFLNIIYPRLKK